LDKYNHWYKLQLKMNGQGVKTTTFTVESNKLKTVITLEFILNGMLVIIIIHVFISLDYEITADSTKHVFCLMMIRPTCHANFLL